MSVINLFREKRTRRKSLYTLLMIAAAMALAQIPVHGISSTYMSAFFSKSSLLSFMDTLTGGAMSKMAVGGFGVTSYITASIIIQLLMVVFPKLEGVRKDGEKGRKLFEKAEIALSIIISLASGIIMSMGFGANGLFTKYTFANAAIANAEWLAGTIIIVLLAVKNEDFGIGNGPTILLGCNIISRLPSSLASYAASYVTGRSLRNILVYGGGLAAGVFVMFVVCIYLQKGMIYVKIRQSRKRAASVNKDTTLPVSVNVANVLPVIYASTLVSFPSTIATMLNITPKGNFKTFVSALSSSNWYSPSNWTHVAGLAAYLLLIVFFGYYSAMLAFSPEEAADGMKKGGDVIPGINPGDETVAYLKKRRNTATVLNVLFLLVIAVLPDFICARAGVTSLSFLGTSMIVVVNMLYDTYTRIKAETLHLNRAFALFPQEKKKKNEGKDRKLCLRKRKTKTA